MATVQTQLQKIAVVTGANKGIGLAIVKALCEQLNNGIVILAARDVKKGDEAVKKLKDENFNVHFEQLDVLSMESIENLKSRIESKHGGIDILVNNAGILYRSVDTTTSLTDRAKNTINTNYFGALNVTNNLLPLCRNEGRIVMVSSTLGMFRKVFPNGNEDLKNRFTSQDQTISGISQLMNEYLTAVANDDYSIWPERRSYNVSKLGLTAITAIFARILTKDPRHIAINSCCPGFINTDLTGNKGVKPPEEGAVTPTMLCITPSSSGDFYYEQKVTDWINDII